MATMKLKPCPFCGAKLKDEWPTVSNFDEGKWSVDHYCQAESPHGLEVSIHAYGRTKAEAVKRWNTRAGEKG